MTRKIVPVIRRVGFVGLGRMGECMARRLADKGFDVRVFDFDRALATRLATTSHAEKSESLRALAAASDVVTTMLPSSDAVRDVTLGAGGCGVGDEDGSQPDSLIGADESPAIILDMGSSDPIETRRLGAELAKRGTLLLDAPVSGGVGGAEDGSLTVMVGGDAHDIETCRPILEQLGRTIIPTGALGSAHAMKALNNLLSAIGLIGALEVLIAGRSFGLETQTMLQVLNGSSGRNHATETKLDRFVLSREFSSGFTLDLLTKDVSTALAFSDSDESVMPLAKVVDKVCRSALEHLGSNRDHTEIARWLEDRTGVHLG